MIIYAAIYALGVFLAAVSQVLLKMEALKEHDSLLAEYLNPMVVLAYTIFLATTLMTVISYWGIPVSLGAVLEATSYLYITAFGALIFKERITWKKACAIGTIILGVVVFALGIPA